MKAMILAAGEGRRMLPLTASVPKPLLHAGGKALIEHQIDKLTRAGIREIVINHAWLGAQIEAALGDGTRYGARLLYSAEGSRLETAGGIIKALPLLGEAPFIVVNADIWTDYSYEALLGLPREGEVAYLVLADNPAHNPGGDFVLRPDGKLAMPEAAADRGQALTFTGISVYHPRFFAGCSPGFQPLLPLLRRAIIAQGVGGERFRGAWMDIGTPERLRELDERLSPSG